MDQKFFSKSTLIMAVVLAVVIGGAYYLKNKAVIQEEMPPSANPVSVPQPISIGSEDIKEKNFTGKIAQIKGDSAVAEAAQAYTEQAVSDFKAQADVDVPEMRDKFGADSPSANYTLDISASLVSSKDTESVVLSLYTYTGGAHGSSFYKVFTASKSSGNIMKLRDVVSSDKEAEFTDFIKKALKKRNSAGEVSGVFPELVDELTFSSFENWSLTDDKLILYFGQYEIGAGALGAVELPLPIEEVQTFLK